jgi:pyoverdine/dityrosine biosynthesis protein Dit1
VIKRTNALEKALIEQRHFEHINSSLPFTTMDSIPDALMATSTQVLSDKSFPVLSDKSSPVLSEELSPALSDKSSTALSDNESSDSSVDNSPQLNATSKMSGRSTSTVPDPEFSEERDDITLMSNRMLEIIFDYALNKFDDCRDRLEAGRPRFIEVLNTFVRAGAKIDMALPAFPFKSANKVYKALGFLPDKAEEIALARLHNMCERIEEIYEPGAKVVIISDGLVYNGLFHTIYLEHMLTRIVDLLSISDRHTWVYGEALRAMAIEKGFTNVDFSRLRDFVPHDSDFRLPEVLDEISYVANATNFRRFILNRFGKDDLDVDQLIAVDEDTRLTYQGYRRFLMSDLKYIFTLGADRTSNAYKRQTKYLAKQMLARGYVSK